MQGYVSGVMIAELIYASDPRADQGYLKAAVLKKTDVLKQRGGLETTRRDQLSESSNTLTRRNILSLMNVGTSDKMAKARSVAQGHKDVEKHFILQDSIALKHSYLKIILTFACIRAHKLLATKRRPSIHPKRGTTTETNLYLTAQKTRPIKGNYMEVSQNVIWSMWLG